MFAILGQARIFAMLDKIRRRLGPMDWGLEAKKYAPAFFVVGDPKSGTGWLTKLLDSHPEVLCRGRGVLFGRHLRREELKSSASPMPPASLQNALLEDEYLRLWVERSGWTEGEDSEECLATFARLAVDHFMGRELARSGKRVAGDKTPFFTEDVLSDMAAIYPKARVIHIVRDGRDVAVSRMHQLWKDEARGHPVDLAAEELARREAFYQGPEAFLASGEGTFLGGRLRELAEGWRTRVGKAVEVGPALFGADYVEVRYENLLEEPEREAARLFRFLGVDANGEVVGRCVGEASFEKGSGRQRGRDDYSLRHGKYRKGVAGDWKTAFAEQDKPVFKETAGALLVELGYEEGVEW